MWLCVAAGQGWGWGAALPAAHGTAAPGSNNFLSLCCQSISFQHFKPGGQGGMFPAASSLLAPALQGGVLMHLDLSFPPHTCTFSRWKHVQCWGRASSESWLLYF